MRALLLIFLISNMGFAQQIPILIQQKTANIAARYKAMPVYMKKVHCQIYDAIQKIDRSKKSIQQLNNLSHLLEIDSEGRIHVSLRTSEITPVLLKQLADNGFEIELSTANLNISPNHQMITGWVHYYQIETIAQISPIFHVRPVDRPMRNTGEVTTAGDYILRADEARQTFGVSGMGQKVGVLSDGIDHWDQVQATGDLPQIEVVRNRFAGDEGTAMLEIVYDLAPRAQLAFADWGNSQADFANNIRMLTNTGCTIIVDDITYLLEPVYEDGVIAQTIDDVAANDNIVYTSAAGNLQQKHCETDFSDNDNNGFHEFDQNVDETINTSVKANRTLLVVMQWNNQFSKATDNYDVYIYDKSLTEILASGTNVQDGNDDPVEYASYENSSDSTMIVHVSIQKVTGKNRNLTLHFWEYNGKLGVDPLEHVDGDGTIFGHPAAKNCLAVGAIYANDPDHNTIEYYSSHGPARIYQYDEGGRPISYEERKKPDHAAIDGVETLTGKLGYFHDPFFGTSAAAPHTAGIAALIREVASHLTAQEVNALINSTCVELGDIGFDYKFGYGRIDAVNAINSLGTAPRIEVNPQSFMLSVDFSTNIDSILEISNLGNLTLNFELSSSDLSKNEKVLDQNLSNRTNKSIRHILPKTKTERNLSLNKNHSSHTLVKEGFESGVMPPEGWQVINGNSSPGQEPAHWRIEDHASYVFKGQYSAFCPYGNNLDEWLITPYLDLSTMESVELKFHWQTSYYWHVDPNDNGDLFVKISTDSGATWTSLWTFGEIGEWSNWTWYETTLNLSAFAGQSSVIIAFHVVADDNADMALDEIEIIAAEPEKKWVTFNPESGNINKGLTETIKLNFNTENLGIGNYTGEIYVKSNDPHDSLITIPVKIDIDEMVNYTISGDITYYSNSTGVDRVLLQLTGGSIDSAITDSVGKFEFQDLIKENYILKAFKRDDYNQVIGAEDASLILQHDVRLISLNPYQKMAGDVSGNNRVTHYDASLILRYCVGSISEFPKGNGWTFIPTNFAINDSNWFNAPDSLMYSPLDSDSINQNLNAVIYGDANGDWGKKRNNLFDPHPTVELGKSKLQENNTLTVPVIINHKSKIYSGELKLAYDTNSLIVRSINQPGLENMPIFESFDKEGKIKIAFASGKGITTSGSYFNIKFETVNEQDNFVQLNSAIINGEKCPIATTIREFASHPQLPTEFKFSQNYPNPFNPTTNINYQIPHKCQVKIIVYNMLGQKIKTLIDTKHDAGYYDILWDGRDDNDSKVVSGIYFYQIKAEEFLETKKMVVIR